MPDIKKIKQAMIEERISEEIISKIDFTDPGGNNPLPVIGNRSNGLHALT